MRKTLLTLFFVIIVSVAFAQQTPPAPKKDPDTEIQIIDPISSRDAEAEKHTDTNRIYSSVEQEPEFPGGMTAFQRYLAVNIRYPAKAVEDKMQGRVFVSFVIEKDGSISNVVVVRKVSPEIDAEAFRVIKNSPRWKHGEQNGVPVRVSYTVPILFHLPAYLQPDSLKVFTAVEQQPNFPGGEAKFAAYTKTRLRYPAAARENGVQGKVFLNFIVERDGSLSDIRVIRGIGSGCDEEALRLLKEGPKWIPGMQNGHAVRVYYTIPIIFEL